jgi:replicative DNA helicase
MPVQGAIYNQVIDGAKKGTLTIRSAASGVGKTRNAVADACYLAYPFRYNSTTCSWEQEGNSEKVLFIVTEQRFKEVRTMILAYLTDINATRFKYADFSDRETAVITQAIALMKKYSENLILVKMPNPTIESVKTIVRENCIIHNIGYVFYDYIFIGPSLLNEFKGFALRNDEVLLMFATALKDLAVELDVAMFSSTQLNAKGDDNKDIRNEGSLAGGRSTINKADNGAIMARPTKEELELLEPLYKDRPENKPNLVTDIFKVRSGEWTQVRIWSVMNLGTLRKRDLFITDSRLEMVEDFFERDDYKVKSWDEHEDEHLKIIVERLNDGEVVD